MNKLWSVVLKLIIFVICVGLIIWGQTTVGYLNLAAQLIGLTGLLGLLYVYNRAYR